MRCRHHRVDAERVEVCREGHDHVHQAGKNAAVATDLERGVELNASYFDCIQLTAQPGLLYIGRVNMQQVRNLVRGEPRQ